MDDGEDREGARLASQVERLLCELPVDALLTEQLGHLVGIRYELIVAGVRG